MDWASILFLVAAVFVVIIFFIFILICLIGASVSSTVVKAPFGMAIFRLSVYYELLEPCLLRINEVAHGSYQKVEEAKAAIDKMEKNLNSAFQDKETPSVQVASVILSTKTKMLILLDKAQGLSYDTAKLAAANETIAQHLFLPLESTLLKTLQDMDASIIPVPVSVAKKVPSGGFNKVNISNRDVLGDEGPLATIELP